MVVSMGKHSEHLQNLPLDLVRSTPHPLQTFNLLLSFTSLVPRGVVRNQL